ncbi:putative pyrroloquinoline-quinone binding quinoprotein [Roseimicrobium gellanilyticum]|uniref:Putative pyrroloquinoline-quinone binding quinoprotein n=1 Tax=Roseimicrobium gellanilyticum TaxID=748857 RepID=A0A366HSQ0_9BACT|nr:PQQ-binding-like beta-propeller repeat protein [Roseimicrobium gellanilyticum]RBP45954.1 putative pyrroloquinoline-quinone binding quinoprotein [Roseimicrobium gellanilyticum]
MMLPTQTGPGRPEAGLVVRTLRCAGSTLRLQVGSFFGRLGQGGGIPDRTAECADHVWGAPLRATLLLLAISFFVAVPPTHSQQSAPTADSAPAAPDSFDKTSIALRTALHYDPAVDVPLQKLVALYRDAGRTEELLSMYGAHVAQFPEDGNAKLVLSRIYGALQDRRAMEFLKSAVAQHPEHALLAWEYGRALLQQHDPKAVDEMARAVSLEKGVARRALWYGELLKAASVQAREDLVLIQTQKLMDEGAMSPEQRLRWARQAMSAKLPKTAALLLKDLPEQSLGADSGVEATVLRAQLLAENGDAPAAVKMLQALQEKLSPEHWRHREILMLRLDLAGAKGRDGFVEEARAKWSKKESRTEADALTFADVLLAAHRGNEALKVLREAVVQFPQSAPLEARVLEVWEAQGPDTEAIAWLEKKLEKQPERGDLQLRRVRWYYAMNQAEKAKAAFNKLLTSLEDAQKIERTVEMARWLRRRNQSLEAVALLESAVEKAPQRWDLRRELAELYMGQRRKEDVAKLFAGSWSKDLPPDARLEIAQFLMVKQLWLEAKELVEPWVASNEGAFEGRLLLAKIFGKLGDDAQVQATLDAARALCDTEARYQAWLDALLEYASAREMTGLWLQREAELLLPTGKAVPEDTLFGRWIVLLEQAIARQEEKFAEAAITRALAASLTPERRLQLEKMRLELLGSDSTRVAEAEAGLRSLMERDAAHREDHRVRLALLYQRAGRGDLAREFLDDLDVGKVTGAQDLRALLPLLQERNLAGQALACAERLTQLEPAERAHWAQWISLLANSGGEERLRIALREVLGKAHDWKLAEEVQQSLRDHLVASQWRSVQMALLEGDMQDWAAARRAAAEFERMELTHEQRLWLRWLRAWFSAGIGDGAAVADALTELGKVDGKTWIAFPDGMELSVQSARDMLQAKLKSPPDGNAAAKIPQAPLISAPLPPFETAWAFALEDGAILTRTGVSQTDGLAYFGDDRWNIFAVDLKTGKLRWRYRADGAPTDAFTNPGAVRRSGRGRIIGGYPYNRYGGQVPELSAAIQFQAVTGRLLVLTENGVECLSAANGSVLWRSAPSGESQAQGTQSMVPQSRLVEEGGCVYYWRPATSRVSAMKLESGRLLWETELPQLPAAPVNPNNQWQNMDMYARLRSGLSVDQGRVLAWAQTAALLHAETGALIWRTGTGELPAFPVGLETEDELASALAAVGTATQTLVRSVQLTFGPGVGLAINGPHSTRSGPAQRWVYGDALRRLLQPQSGLAPTLILRGEEVWGATANNDGLVTMLGLPVAGWGGGGCVVGFEGRRVINDLGGVATVTMVGTPSNSITLFPEPDIKPGQSLNASGGIGTISTPSGFVIVGQQLASANPGAPGEPVHSSVLEGSRFYASTPDRLRAADVRSGATLFDLPWPKDAAEWVKAETSRHPTAMMPMLPGMGGQAMAPQYRRVYVPQGVFLQDQRMGGGILCGPLSAVAEDLWIAPLHDRAVICLRGQFLKQKPVATAAPVNVPPDSNR